MITDKIITELSDQIKKLKDKIINLENDVEYYRNLAEESPMRMEYEDLD